MRPYITFEEFPDDIAKALKRADACWRYDIVTDARHIKSRNTKEPLTDKEKQRIKNYLRIHMFPMEVVFDD